jgi:DnaJ family protein C protein 11
MSFSFSNSDEISSIEIEPEEETQPSKPKQKNEGEERNCYGILNVSTTATPEEIRAAYKRLAVTYHPDMHTRQSPQIIQEAKEKFTEIKTAYETLIDPQKRTLYDMYGINGLNAGWELAKKLQTPEEVS